MTAEEIRNLLLKKKLSIIQKCYFEYLAERLKPKNLLFFSERGDVTHIKDLNLLSFNQDSELF